MKPTPKIRPNSRSSEEVLDATIDALAGEGDDALAKAAAEGFPDPEGASAWTERVLAVLLHQRDRFALRSELPTLADRLRVVEKNIAVVSHILQRQAGAKMEGSQLAIALL